MASRSDGPPAGRPFFGRIESLRGLGALAVAAYHVAGWQFHGVPLLPETPWDGAGPTQNALRQIGLALFPAHAALMLFFVISGFVLRLSLAHGPQDAGRATGRFLLGRVFRIYPVVVVATALMALLGSYHGADTTPLTARQFVANLLLLDVSMNLSLWALQLELLVAPAIVALYYLERARGTRALVGVALIASVLSFAPARWPVWPPLLPNVFAFVLGMLVPTVGRQLGGRLSPRAAAAVAVMAVIALVLPSPLLGVFSRKSALIEAYAAVVLVSLTAYRTDVAALSILDAWPLRQLGLASGSYYVLHMLTVPLALTAAMSVVPVSWSVTVPVAVGALVIGAWLAALAPVAWCSYHLIEATGVAIGRRVTRALGLDAARPQPVPAVRRVEPVAAPAMRRAA
jgi:peptidoglycan/LPS O-acetylase OafA/YrhL